jgi:hypothetical protein
MITSTLLEKLYRKLSITKPGPEKNELSAQIRDEFERLRQAEANIAEDQAKRDLPIVTQMIGFTLDEVMQRIGERFKPKERNATREFSFYDREKWTRVTVTVTHEPDTMTCSTHGVQPIVLIDPNAPERGMRCEVCLAEIVEKEGSSR